MNLSKGAIMGIEVVLIIAITSGVVSLISGGASLGTIIHVKRKLKKVNIDNVKLDIENEDIETVSPKKYSHVKKQSIHFENMGMEMITSSNQEAMFRGPNPLLSGANEQQQAEEDTLVVLCGQGV